MTIRGEVTPDREAVIRIRLRSSFGRSTVRIAQVDTGFTDFLALSASDVAALGYPLIGAQEYKLGDAEPRTFRIFAGLILWEGRTIDVDVVESEGGPLIGMALLYGRRLTIDVIDGGPVTVSTLTS